MCLQLIVSDWGKTLWVTCFSDLAEQLLGDTAENVGKALEHNKEQAERIFASLAFRPFVLKMRIKQEYYGDVLRPKTTAVAATPINYKERNAYLVKNLERMTGIAKVV